MYVVLPLAAVNVIGVAGAGAKTAFRVAETTAPFSAVPSNVYVRFEGNAVPLKQTVPCNLPNGATRVVPKICCRLLVKLVAPAVRLERFTRYPLCSCTVSCCAHWHAGSACGSCCTVAGAAVSVMDGAICGPTGPTKRAEMAWDHVFPSASTPVSTKVRVIGTESPPTSELDMRPLAGIVSDPNKVIGLVTPLTAKPVSLVATPAFSVTEMV